MNRIKYVLYLSLFSLIMHSCLKDEKDFFDQSAAERMNTALKEYKNILTNSEFGWVLEYYPEKNQSYGGYIYTISFTEEEATVGYELADTQSTVTSLYKLIGDNGPVLTFDDYNSYLHHFATPSQSSPDGQEGDYEFIILNASENEVLLKGKKTGNKMRLSKNTKESKLYLENVKDMASKITANNLILKVGSEEIPFERDSRNKNLIFTFEAENGKIEQTKAAYIITENEFKLYSPLPFVENIIQNFKLSEDQNTLICIDEGTNAEIMGPIPLESYLEGIGQLKKYSFIKDKMSDNIKSIYERIQQSFNAKNISINKIALTYTTKSKEPTDALYIETNKGIGYLYFTKEITGNNQIKYTYSGTGDNNGKIFYNYDGISDLVNIINSTLALTPAISALNPSSFRFTNIEDSSIWFILSL